MVELFTKMILYYFHEQFWLRSKVKDSNKRHLYKTFSWRFLGTADTIAIGWLISGDPFIGLQIDLVEVITKMILYFYTKGLYRLDFGLEKENTGMSNIVRHNFNISKSDREKLHQHKAFLIWFTGLSGSEKSTIANALELKLNNLNISTYSLDGDNIRIGINKDLTFSPEDEQKIFEG